MTRPSSSPAAVRRASSSPAGPISDEAEDLERLLGRLEAAIRGGPRVTLRTIHSAIGSRAFGPLLVVPALAALTPLGLIPGAPTAFALIIILTAGQLVVGCKDIWLPGWLLRRSVSTGKLRKALRAAKPIARFFDRLTRPRLRVLTGAVATRLVAIVCLVIAVAIPPLELVPFGVAAPAWAILAFGLGLLSKDGVLVLLALVASGATVGVAAYAFL